MLGAFRRRFPPTIRQLLKGECTEQNTQIEVNGWVKSVRRQKNVSFAVISDGSSTRGLQAVFDKDVIPSELTNGCSVTLHGKLVKSPGALQDKEFQVESVAVVGQCDPEIYPIQKKELSVEYLRDQCHLRARVDSIGQMLRIRDSLMRGIHSYFEEEGFMYAHTPIITSSDSEGAGDAFSVNSEVPSASGEDAFGEKESMFFRRKAYLTVSSQLHLEALSTACSRVYTLSPCFRAERSQTSRHLAEFWMLEAEWTFTKQLDDVCAVVEDVIKSAVQTVLKDEGSKNEDLQKRAEEISLNKSWERIRYIDAIHELQAVQSSSSNPSFRFKPTVGKPLQSEHEKWLAEKVGGPVFVTDYPWHLKPFYMRRNDDGQTVSCFDLLMPGLGELVGGSLREERLDMLDQAMVKHSMQDKEEYWWYRELRKYGGAPHAGFGLGFERLVSVLTGQGVRECIAMPRWTGRMLL